jgi:histone-lysine N-methyltransferase SETMAR
MNQTVYITVLQHLQDVVHQKRPHKWSSGTWLLHHNNASCNAALSVREFLAKHSIPVVPHPPYSSDLAPCDFFLFPRLKSTLKGKRFQDNTEIQLNKTQQLQAISKQATRHALKSGRIAEITAYNLEGCTLKEITLNNL